MIHALIIEDEEPASNRLTKLIKSISSDIKIIGSLDSVESAINWFNSNKAPELLFVDIQLADGNSFEIFKQVQIDSFVIFTTAYDQYAIKAFELNSIDYLLKPINKEKLAFSINKFQNLSKQNHTIDINNLISIIEKQKVEYKSRFAIQIGTKIKLVKTDDISSFYSLEGNSFLYTNNGNNYAIDFSLDRLEELLDPNTFFRINRQFIVNYNSITKVSIISKSKVKIELDKNFDFDMIVSTHKSKLFRKWLNR